MRQDERKGAWTLLIAVLVFGALVWGIGGRKFREDRRQAEERQETQISVMENPADSVNDRTSNGSSHKRKRRASDRSKANNSPSAATVATRDILADTIKIN